MNSSSLVSVAGCCLFAVLGAVRAQDARQPPEGPPPPAPAPPDSYVLDFRMKLIDGTEQDLAEYRGKVVVMVNVASRCGYTPQYAALQSLYASRKDRGLVILAFPANNFRQQEPGSNEEIAAFCQERYGVTFPVFEKISVRGDDAHPLYRKLAAQPPPLGGPPRWNFTKFIVNRQGHVVARVDARTRPDLEPELIATVDALLAEPVPQEAGGPNAGKPDRPRQEPSAPPVRPR